VWRSAFDRVGPFLAGEPIASDSDWFMRAKDLGLDSEILEEVLLERRIHGGNQSSNVRAGHLQLLRSVRRSVARQRGGGGGETP